MKSEAELTTDPSGITVIKGPAAIRIGKYWSAVLSGDVWLPKQFRTPEAALKYGAKREKSN